MRDAEARSIHRGLRLCAAGLCALVALRGPTRAHADAPEFALHDAPTCALAGDFAAQVLALVPAGTAKPARIHVTLADETGGVSVTLVVSSAAGTHDRNLLLPSCGEANNAAVLLAALAIDPHAHVTRTRPEESARSVRPRPAPEALFARAAGMLDAHTFGGPSGGPALDIGAVRGQFVVDVGGRYAAPRAVQGAPRAGHVRGQLGSVAVRAGVRVPLGRARGSLLAGAEAGAVRADAPGLADAHSQRGPFLAALLAGSLEFVASRRVSLDAGLELGVTLLRPKLAVADQAAFFALPPVVGKLTLGLRWWPLAEP